MLKKHLLFPLAVTTFAINCMAGEFNCMIEPTQIIELGSSVAGRVTQVHAKRGDVVTKNQILVTLESSAEKAASELAKFKSVQAGPAKIAESKIEFSIKKLNRRQEMVSQKLMAAQDSEDIESEVRLAEAELKVAQENRQIAKLELQQQNSLLNLRSVRSPVSGVVVDQAVYTGEVFEPGSSKKYILKIAEINPLKVHVILPKSMFGKLKLGMFGKVASELMPTDDYLAKVTMIDKLIDGASGTFVVFLEIQNPKFQIPAGIKCKVSFANDHS